MASDQPKEAEDSKEKHSDLLDFLGISFGKKKEIEKPSRFVLWKENEVAFFMFRKLAFTHSQWLTGGMGGLLGLDGNYCLSYIRLTHSKKKSMQMLDDVMCIASGYINEANKKKD